MGKITQVNNGDTGLQARTKINEAMKSVESDATLSGSGTLGDPLKVVDSGASGGLTIPTQTPTAIADAATTNIPLDNTQLNYSFADGNTTWTITVNGGSDTEVKKAVRILDNSANNDAVLITLSNANMTIKEDDGNNLSLAANSVHELEVKGRSTSVCLLSIIPDKA